MCGGTGGRLRLGIRKAADWRLPGCAWTLDCRAGQSCAHWRCYHPANRCVQVRACQRTGGIACTFTARLIAVTPAARVLPMPPIVRAGILRSSRPACPRREAAARGCRGRRGACAHLHGAAGWHRHAQFPSPHGERGRRWVRVVAAEGRLPRVHLVHQRAEGVHVRLPGRAPPPRKQLRRRPRQPRRVRPSPVHQPRRLPRPPSA